ncbi:hypothetical protein RQP46_004306 [Phenoliferia psychrophenolica]
MSTVHSLAVSDGSGTLRSSAPTPPSPPRRSLSFPPEVLLTILTFVSDSYAEGVSYDILITRNDDLAELALVSRAFQAATYSVLYGDLRLAWMADRLNELQNSFGKNPQLLSLVHRLEARAVQKDNWVERNFKSRCRDHWRRELWLEGYFKENNIQEDSEEWHLLKESLIEDGRDPIFDDYVRAEVTEEWAARGSGSWDGKETNPEGALELLDFVASAPRLRSVIVRNFEAALRPVDIQKRGPYPLIESLAAPHFDPRIDTLLQAQPNLRSLSLVPLSNRALITHLLLSLDASPTRRADVLPANCSMTTLHSSAEGLSPDPPSPPRRSLSFPPEVLLLIVSFASDSYVGGDYKVLTVRNAALVRLALVNRAFQAATYSVLYGDLRLAWMPHKVDKLRTSFIHNPHLLPLVRRLEATAVHEDDWAEDACRSRSGDIHRRKAWLESYCRENDIQEGSLEWQDLFDTPIEEGPTADDFDDDIAREVAEAWTGHGTWKSQQTGSQGVLELLVFVGSAPVLPTVVLQGFNDDFVTGAPRGPYPLLESLAFPASSPYLIHDHLYSFLASCAPNLRSLSGYLNLRPPGPMLSLPPSLTHLEIDVDSNPRYDTFLLQAQPNLRSLSIMPESPNWASRSTITTCLSSLETLVVNYSLYPFNRALITPRRVANAPYGRPSSKLQPPPAGGLSPDKPTAPHRSLSFPPEVLLLVLSFASDSYIGGEAETLNARNAELARIALVSRAFQAATYSVLYGDLRLPWMADTVKQLRKSFSKNSQLLPLVRRLEASAVDEYAWVEDDYDSRSSDEQVREEWLESYCERNGIEEESDEWIGLNENPIEDGDAADDFEDDMRSDAKMAWSASGHGAWQAKRTNPEGALEVLDFVGSAPALRRLVVRDFLTPLRAVDLAKRGSYPLIESLVLPQDSPFLADGRLAPFLVSRAPNLRSLSGYADQTHRTGDTSCPFISIPPSLTSLRFIGYDQDDPRIEPLLLQAQPRLRSLFLMPGIPETEMKSSR